jgi:hypothetical protein
VPEKHRDLNVRSIEDLDAWLSPPSRVASTRPVVPAVLLPRPNPSHVAPETPGPTHEGGELGYALVHA